MNIRLQDNGLIIIESTNEAESFLFSRLMTSEVSISTGTRTYEGKRTRSLILDLAQGLIGIEVPDSALPREETTGEK